MVSVVIAEDHQVVRQGFKSILEGARNLEVTAETGDGLEAVRLVEELSPDLLVADLSLPGLDGLEVTRQVRARAPGTKVIILSMHADEGYVVSALRSGARAYVLKEAGADELLKAVDEVVNGREYLSNALPEEDIQRMQHEVGVPMESRYDTLSVREREVLHLIAEGYSSPEIGERLFISPRTVDTHRSNIIAKLGLKNVSDLIRYAVERGLIPPRNARSDLSGEA